MLSPDFLVFKTNKNSRLMFDYTILQCFLIIQYFVAVSSSMVVVVVVVVLLLLR